MRSFMTVGLVVVGLTASFRAGAQPAWQLQPGANPARPALTIADNLYKQAMAHFGPDWDMWVSDDGGFSVLLPVHQPIKAVLQPPLDGKRQPSGAWFHTILPDNTGAMVNLTLLSKGVEQLPQETLLDLLRQTSPARGLKPRVQIPRRFGPNIGLDTLVDIPARGGVPAHTLRHRFVLVGRRLYTIAVTGPDLKAVSSWQAMRFFRSLRLTPTARSLTDLEKNPELVEITMTPNFQQALKDVPGHLKDSDRAYRLRVALVEAMLLLEYDPTYSAYSAAEHTHMFLKHLEDIEKQMQDPATPVLRKLELQQYINSRMALFRRAHDMKMDIYHKILQSQARLNKTNALWNQIREANKALVEAKMVEMSAEDAIWKAAQVTGQ